MVAGRAARGRKRRAAGDRLRTGRRRRLRRDRAQPAVGSGRRVRGGDPPDVVRLRHGEVDLAARTACTGCARGPSSFLRTMRLRCRDHRVDPAAARHVERARLPDDRADRGAPRGGCGRSICRRDHAGVARQAGVTADRTPVRVLALSPIPEEGAGCRFRIAQFMPYLESVGVDVTLSSLFTTEFFRLVYKPGHYARKALTFAALSARRLGSLRGLRRFDVVFIYREMFTIGPAIVERLIAARGRPPIVFDFDDAIFLPNVSDANRLIGVLKRPQKVAAIIRSSDHVITGNEYLAAYARRFSSAVTMIPTSVDTDRFVPCDGDRARADEPIVGWIGSPTTSSYIRSLAPVLRRVRERQPFTLRVSGAGERFDVAGLRI